MAKKTYRVKKGDNYFKIAEKLWGNQLFAGQLIRANPGINKLFPGIVLKLPKVDINDPHPFFGQAAWERAGRTSGSSGRLPGQTPPYQEGMNLDRQQERQRRREELLDAKLGPDLPGYEYDVYPQRSGPGYEEDPAYGRRGARRTSGMRREDIPDWVYEDFNLEDLGGFSHEEVWDEVNEFVRLAEELGLAPRQVEEPEGAGVLGAPGEVGQTLPETAEDEGAVKGDLRPAQQEPTPTADQAEALRILDIGFGAQLSDAVVLGKQSDSGYLNTLWEAYRKNRGEIMSGEMSLADVKEKVYGDREIEIEPGATPTPEPTATQTPTADPQWQNFSQNRVVVSALLELQNPDAIQEEFQIWQTGFPESGYLLPGELLFNQVEYPQGSGDGIEDAKQYTDLSGVLGEGYGDHYNLCGAYAAAHTSGLTGEEVLIILNQLPDGKSMLRNNGLMTEDMLIDLYNELGMEEVGTIGMYSYDDYQWDKEESEVKSEATPELIINQLNQGYAITAIVNIDGGEMLSGDRENENYGLLIDAYDPGVVKPTNHFVNILSVSQNSAGEYFVRIFNPFQDREEIYSWDRFSKAWDNYDTTGRFRAILSSPPSSPAP